MHVVEGELDRTELALLVKCKIALKSEAFFSRKKGILALQRKVEVVKKRNYFLSSWLGLSQNPHGFLPYSEASQYILVRLFGEERAKSR